MITQEKVSRGERAKEYFLQGYNCTQAVALAFSDKLDIDKETLVKLASSFGGGMGRLREVCGAVSGMFIVLGALDGYSSPEDFEGKKRHYANIQELAYRFKEENGSFICKELLSHTEKTDGSVPEIRTENYYKKRPCAELVKSAAEILDEYLKELDKAPCLKGAVNGS